MGPVDPPIWPCSARGLPCPDRRRPGGGLLPHLFTLTPPDAGRCVFCGTFPRVAAAGRYPACSHPEFGLSSVLQGRIASTCRLQCQPHPTPSFDVCGASDGGRGRIPLEAGFADPRGTPSPRPSPRWELPSHSASAARLQPSPRIRLRVQPRHLCPSRPPPAGGHPLRASSPGLPRARRRRSRRRRAAHTGSRPGRASRRPARPAGARHRRKQRCGHAPAVPPSERPAAHGCGRDPGPGCSHPGARARRDTNACGAPSCASGSRASTGRPRCRDRTRGSSPGSSPAGPPSRARPRSSQAPATPR